jgi:multidrug transporter EmrE-like cation transporter
MVVYLLSRAHKIAPMGLVNAVCLLSIITIASVGYFAFDQKLTPDQIAVMGVIGLGVVYLAINVEPVPG